MSNLPALAHVSALVIHQQKEMLEIFTDFETKNRYVVQLPDGQPALYAAETGRGAWEFITRSFLKARRPFSMQLVDVTGKVVFQLERPWTWFFSELHIRDGQGQRIGVIDQKFAFLARKFVVLDASGREAAQIHGPFLRPWTFRVLQGEQEVGKITKQWSGFLQEAFTDADTFGVEMGPAMGERLRALVLAATFLIDFLYFEDRS